MHTYFTIPKRQFWTSWEWDSMMTFLSNTTFNVRVVCWKKYNANISLGDLATGKKLAWVKSIFRQVKFSFLILNSLLQEATVKTRHSKCRGITEYSCISCKNSEDFLNVIVFWLSKICFCSIEVTKEHANRSTGKDAKSMLWVKMTQK